MKELLKEAEQELPLLLMDEAGWKSLDITYHPPRVERLWRPWRDCRLSLHFVHPCESGKALYHPHPWPQIVHVLHTQGLYEMGVGHGPRLVPPPIAMTSTSSHEFIYEMLDPDGWHYVRPINGPSLSVMLTGKPWGRAAPSSPSPLMELSQRRMHELFDLFRCFFPYISSTVTPT